MTADFAAAFAALRTVLARHSRQLAVKADTSDEYTLVTISASPFKQHKGQPLHFGSVRVGKAYVSFHLMPIYMSPTLTRTISPALKKRMQGKSCFNFKAEPEPELIADLTQLTKSSINEWAERRWL